MLSLIYIVCGLTFIFFWGYDPIAAAIGIGSIALGGFSSIK